LRFFDENFLEKFFSKIIYKRYFHEIFEEKILKIFRQKTQKYGFLAHPV
jgi:hypothetical protein